jgi:hypothetical protein
MKQKIILIIMMFIASTIITTSCLKKQAKKLTQTTVSNSTTVGFCDTITYAKHIAPIITMCNTGSSCHNAAPRILLTNYTQVKNAIDGGQITINTSNKQIMGGGKSMSNYAGTTTLQDDWFTCWKDNGLKNN